MDLQETVCEGVHWIHSTQDRVQWPALVKMLWDIRVPRKGRITCQLRDCQLLKQDSAPLTCGLVLVRMYLQSNIRRALRVKLNVCASRPQENNRKMLQQIQSLRSLNTITHVSQSTYTQMPWFVLKRFMGSISLRQIKDRNYIPLPC